MDILATESFISWCDDMMIAEESDIGKATKEFRELRKKVDAIKKEMNTCKDDPKKQIALLEETKSVLNESKSVIKELDVTDSDVTVRKILSVLCILFVPWFIGIPLGVVKFRGANSKNEALDYINQRIASANRKIASLKEANS